MKHTLIFGILCAAVCAAAPSVQAAPAAPAKAAPAVMDHRAFGESMKKIQQDRSLTSAQKEEAYGKFLKENKNLSPVQIDDLKSRIFSAKVGTVGESKQLTTAQRLAAYEKLRNFDGARKNQLAGLESRIKETIEKAPDLSWKQKAEALEKMLQVKDLSEAQIADLKAGVIVAVFKAEDDKAFEAKLAQMLKTASVQDKWQMYKGILAANRGSMNWFQRGFWQVGTYEHWYRWTNELLKLDDAQPADKKLGGGAFHKEVAFGAFTCGLYDLAYKEIRKAIEMKTVDLPLAARIFLLKKDHAALKALIDEQRKAWNYQKDDMFWRAVLYFDGGTCKDFDARFTLAAPELDYVAYPLSSKWTYFAPKTLGGAEWHALSRMTDIPAEFAGVKGTEITTNADGLYRVPGKPELKTPALYVQVFDAPKDGYMRIGIGADWFFRVYVNGKIVFDKFGGNNKVPTAATNHTFVAPVKQGKNIIAIPMLSGNAGSEICVGKPADKMTSADKLLLLRRVSELYFPTRRYEVCRDIYNYTYNEMFYTITPKVYNVRFVKDPPRSADGFARSAYYGDWANMETRFTPYGNCPNISNSTDVTWFLKDTKKPEIKPEWKTGVMALCNEEGVHLYFRGNDPKIEDVTTGKRTAGDYECTFRPSEESVYNMWFFNNLPSAKDEVNLDFASPSPRYSLTEDHFLRDACLTPEAVVAHTFIPWYAFPKFLPFNGKCWYLGLQRWCAGGSMTLSGQVHELARMLNLKFNFTPEQELAVKRHICLKAFNTFNKNFDRYVWETDKELGDPEFYKSELEPLVKELRDAGAELQKEGADVNMFFEKYLDTWANFSYVMEAKRKDYLKKKFFK